MMTRFLSRPPALALTFGLTLLTSASGVSGCAEALSTGAGGDTASSSSGAGGAASSTSSVSSSSSASASSGASTSSGAGGGGGGDGGFGVLSLNLHCLKVDGTSFATNSDRFNAIAALIAKEGVDVVLLQEACVKGADDALEMLRAATEKATGASFTGAWSFAHIGWQGTPDESDEGLALLVRGAIAGEETLEHAVQAGLRRVAVSAALPGAASGLRATTVHFDVADASARRMQARETAAAALVGTDPGFGAIVGGDFNDIKGSDAHNAFVTTGYIDASAGLDAAGIDHIFIHRAAPFRPSSAELVFTGAGAVSDHPGVLVRFIAAPGDAVTPTRIIGEASPGAGHFVSVRGSVAPLSWDVGFPMRAAPPSSWRFVTTEVSSAFAFKLLKDDAVWQMGADVQGTAGKDHDVTPAF